jgi:hypothetical protein
MDSVRGMVGLLLLAGGIAAHAQAQTPPAASWLAQAQGGLAAAEYRVQASGRGWQAPNRAQGFRTYFDEQGIRLATRDEQGVALGALRLSGVGRKREAQDARAWGPGSGNVTIDATRVSLRRDGLELAYDNGPDGLRQSLRLQRRPAGAGRLSVAFDVTGATLQATANTALLRSVAALSAARGAPGKAVSAALDARFARAHEGAAAGDPPASWRAGAALRIGAFEARDARGAGLPVTVAAEGGRLWLAIDDRGAAYPLTIKSLIDAVVDGRAESNQANSRLGTSVAGAGVVNGDGFADVIIGADGYDNGNAGEGAAFVYFGGAAGFDPGADAVLDPDQAGAQFGTSVAGAGDVNGDGYADVVVGAIRYDDGDTDEGAAFIYVGGAGAFNATADARLEPDQANAFFGISVAGAGDVNGDGFADVIVGALGFDNGQADEGAAFVYFGSGSSFDTGADARLEQDQASASLGTSVSSAGDVNGDGFADVIVGASAFDNGQADEGAAFLWFGGPGAFNLAHDAMLESNQASAQFGLAVSGAGDANGDGFADVVVGAFTYDNGQADEGAAFVYFGAAGAFNATPDAQLESNRANALLGRAVAAAGDVNGDGYGDVLVGASGYVDGQFNEGAAFVYFGGAGVFDAGADASIEADVAGAQLGVAVAGAGDIDGDGFADIVVGANGYAGPEASEGAAFVYLGGAAFRATFDGEITNAQAGTQLGYSVAGAGDVNGDGFADVIVGASLYDTGQADAGAVFVYFGGPGAFDAVFDARLEAGNAFDRLGFSVANAGDINGDGFDDVLAGAPYHDNGQKDEGAMYVWYGGAGAFDATIDAKLESNVVDAWLGLSVAGAGDVNGDGYADVLAGQPLGDAALLWFGGAGPFEPTADARLDDGSRAGSSVAGAGDVNGDGFADVLVGASYDAEVFVYFGGAGAFDASPDARLTNGVALSDYGFIVAGAGDVNGDGFSDVLVGAPQYEGQLSPAAGAVYLYFGGPGVFDPVADAFMEGFQPMRFGVGIAGAGDVNRDGYADIVVGAWLYDDDNVGTNEGIAYLYFGSAGAFNMVPDVQLGTTASNSGLGFSVAGAGDVNGDGFPDVVIGAPAGGFTTVPRALVYFGAARGRRVMAAQYRGDGSAPVPRQGLSRQPDGFLVSLDATSPRGRERARLELETCPAGQPFGSLLCDHDTAANWTDLGASAAGATLVLPATGLANDRSYHWRARVQYAALAGPVPPNPAVGPWQRLQGNGDVADIRTSAALGSLLFRNGFE